MKSYWKISVTTLGAPSEGVDSYNQKQNNDDDDNKNCKHLMFIEHLLCAGHCLEAFINSLDSS